MLLFFVQTKSVNSYRLQYNPRQLMKLHRAASSSIINHGIFSSCYYHVIIFVRLHDNRPYIIFSFVDANIYESIIGDIYLS